MEYNLGFLAVVVYFLFFTLSKEKKYRYLVLGLFPLFYYVVGAYAPIFIGMVIFYSLFFEKGKYRFVFSITVICIAVVSFFVFKEILFLQPVGQLLLYPLPVINSQSHRIPLLLFSGYLVLYPVTVKQILLLKTIRINLRIFSLATTIVIFFLTTFYLSHYYNNQTASVLQLEKLVFENKWDKAVEFYEKSPSQNLIGQYFYNISLSESDQLCERLFYGSQDFGVNSLILPWENEHLNWGATFYYSVGLINEAHRWAYEGMVVYGKRPQNLKLLVKTNLINENYLMAGKYIHILKRTFAYRNWAKKYEKLVNNPTLIGNYPELEAKRKILPEKDFFIQINSPQNNIPLLLDSNPKNKKAFEYKIAWLMLSKDIETIVKNIKELKTMGYSHIPRHIEEAALIYYNSTGQVPDLGGLAIRTETFERFNQYVSAFKNIRQNSTAGKLKMQQDFGNSFMYYFHFK
jgi:hypothetical protein